MLRKLATLAFAVLTMLTAMPLAVDAQTTVPGQRGRDGVVTGHYTQESGGCSYVVNYRGDFGGNPFLDNGWIMNNITCSDETGTSTYHYLIVHETDPRYTGNPDWAVWGTWEYHVLTQGGQDHTDGLHGNLVRPDSHIGK